MNTIEQAEGPHARYCQVDLLKGGEQVAVIAAVPPIGRAKLGHRFEVLYRSNEGAIEACNVDLAPRLILERWLPARDPPPQGWSKAIRTWRNVLLGGDVMVESSFCRRQVRDLLCVLLTGISLAGCIDLNRPVSRVAGPCLGGSGTVVQDAFRVSVNDVRWTDTAMRAGMEYVPEAQRAMLGEQVYARPQANFVMIDLQITNTTKRPIAWADFFPTYGKSYKLINDDGAVYEASPQLSNVISGTVGGNINPGMSVGGTVVFDVPKGKYDFIIEHTSFAGYGALTRYFSGTEVFRCSLPPA